MSLKSCRCGFIRATTHSVQLAYIVNLFEANPQGLIVSRLGKWVDAVRHKGNLGVGPRPYLEPRGWRQSVVPSADHCIPYFHTAPNRAAQ